jgi:hypothetical protein
VVEADEGEKEVRISKEKNGTAAVGWELVEQIEKLPDKIADEK